MTRVYILVLLCLINDTDLFGQDSLQTHAAIKIINLVSRNLEGGFSKYEFDAVVRHIYSLSIPKNGSFKGQRVNDTIRGLKCVTESRDTLIEEQVYNACLTAQYPAGDSTLLWEIPVALKLCSRPVSCHYIEKKDTIKNRIFYTVWSFHKYDPVKRKYLPDKYADTGYAVATTIYRLKTGKAFRRNIVCFYQSGRVKSRSSRRGRIEKETLYDQYEKKTIRRRIKYDIGSRKKGHETQSKKQIWYFRKDGRLCLKKETVPQ